ncbi:MAG: Do family serine endopeptidase [Alphaproteobacteria bacterium]|nr:Do family serine endopeptidase [Alphaproteobacteria bacterium]
MGHVKLRRRIVSGNSGRWKKISHTGFLQSFRCLSMLFFLFFLSLSGSGFSSASSALFPRKGEKDRMPMSFSGIVKQVRPAVVSVQVEGKKSEIFETMLDIPEDHPFNDFFRRFFDEREWKQIPERGHSERDHSGRGHPGRHFGKAQGSGFIISKDGYVVTNHHVIKGASGISVIMDDGKEYKAERVGADPKTDLAVLKIKTDKPLPYVNFSKQDVEIGDWIVAVGNPFGLGGSVTVGVVSARGRDIGAGPYDDFIQIDASINRGNSGGPAFDLNGNVVGVNTAIFSPSGGSVGIAFAIPADVVIDVVDQLKTHGNVKRGWLGVQIQKVTEDIAASFGLDAAKGAIIAKVMSEGPAKDAGLKDGDLILMVNNEEIDDFKNLSHRIAAIKPGSIANLTVMRGNKKKIFKVKLGTQPSDMKFGSTDRKKVDLDDWGLTLLLSEKGKKDSEDEGGVLIVDVKEGSEADEKGIRVSDMILGVGGVSVQSPQDVLREMDVARKKKREAVLLRIRSKNLGIRFIALPFKKG